MVLAGCSVQPNTSFSGSNQDNAPIPQTSDIGKESTTEDFSSQEVAEKTTTESMQENTEQTASESTDKPKTTKSETEKTKSPATSTETSVVQSEPPVQTEKQPATEPMPETMTETETAPETEPEQAEPFNIDYWISYAKTTAQQNGLSLDSTSTDCWDNPISANPNCIYLERDINSRMSRYVRDGFTCVWVWYECIGTDSYLIYVGYA